MLIDLNRIINFCKKDLTGVIHVGAHYGEEFEQYLRFGINTIHAFEPLKKNFNLLKSKFIKNENIHLYNVALGNKSGSTNMYLSSNNLESSSILKPFKHLQQHKEIKFEGFEKVTIQKLDSYEISNSCNFLNIDVQGYELEVLKGSEKTLQNIDCINCEVNSDETYENNALIHEIDSFLAKFNFIKVKVKWAGENLTWGDAVYVKNYKFSKLPFKKKIKVIFNFS